MFFRKNVPFHLRDLRQNTIEHALSANENAPEMGKSKNLPDLIRLLPHDQNRSLLPSLTPSPSALVPTISDVSDPDGTRW